MEISKEEIYNEKLFGSRIIKDLKKLGYEISCN